MTHRLWYLVLGALAMWAWQRANRPWRVRAVVEFPAALLPSGTNGVGVVVHGLAAADGDDDGGDGDALPDLDPEIWGQA